MAKSLSELVVQAGVILKADRSDIDALLDEIDAYTEDFAAWYSGFEEEPAESSELSQLEELNELHSGVIDLATRLQSQTSKQRQELKKRGKGILSYVNVLPKRISFLKGRKG